MSDLERTPLLSNTGKVQTSWHRNEESPESTTLLSGSDSTPRYDGEQDDLSDDEAAIRLQLTDTISTPQAKKKSRRWPSIIAITVLALLSVAIIVVAFFVPAAVEEYAKQAAVLEPTNLSLESITAHGVRARIQANFRLDGQRVPNEHVRRVGKATAWFVRELGTEETIVRVFLPEYGDVMIGSATLPPLTFNILDGFTTTIDFVAELTPGDSDGLRTIANEWLDGRLDILRVQGKADIRLKSGIIPLGVHSVSESLNFEANKLPTMPKYNITKMSFHEAPILGEDQQAMVADVSILAFNPYPVSVDIPELNFEVLVPGCILAEPYITVAEAKIAPIAIRPRQEVQVKVYGLIRDIPESLTKLCPDSTSSPLDIILKDYIAGKEATLFVRGDSRADSSVPNWLSGLLSSVVVPVPFPGHSFDNLVKNLSMTDVHFTMPDPTAEPDDPSANPKVSGTIIVFAALPPGMDFEINVTDVKADADVFYKSRKLGELNIEEWQSANSSKMEPADDEPVSLHISARINDVPLNVTDSDVLTDIIQTLLFGGKEVTLTIAALVAVKVQTVLGELVLKDVPASGKVPVKPLGKGVAESLELEIGDLEIINTTTHSFKLRSLVNISNPTPYTATVPFVNVHVMCNGSIIGEATGQNLKITTGHNPDLQVSAIWDPRMGGGEAVGCARNLLSAYISGLNTKISVRGHRDSIPGQPLIGEILSRLNLTFSAPQLKIPGHEEDQKPHFIQDATFHILSSTATFTLTSPLHHDTLYIDHVNATAYYNHTEPIGRIEHDIPIVAPPGLSRTPKIPVQWSLNSVGYEKLRNALGGRLKLDAKAVVQVRLGVWTETLWYVGRGIGAGVRL